MRRPDLRGGLLLALVGCAMSCEGFPSLGGDQTPAAAPAAAATASAPLPPPLAALGDLARPTDVGAAKDVDSQGGTLPLADGTSLVVSPGALPGRTRVVLRRVDMSVDLFFPDAQASWAYVLESDVDVPQLAAPVALVVPRPPAAVAVARWTGTTFAPEPLAAGPVTRIEIRHLSTNLVVLLESGAARLTGPDAQSRVEAGWIRERGNESARAFHGVGDRYTGDRGDLCSAFFDVLRTEATSFEFPPGASRGVWELGTYLHDGNAPSITADNYFWRRTVGSHGAIEGALLSPATPAPVTPARMLAICVRANGGNAPLGVLACHNYLKDLTYSCRNKQPHEMPPRCGRIAARLQTWRSSDEAPSGALDKMGPLYHVFAAMSAGVWFPGRGLAGVGAVVGEALLRSFSHGADRPDPEKAEADICGARIGMVIRFPEPVRNAVLHGIPVPELPGFGATPSSAAPGGTAAPEIDVSAWLGRWRGRSTSLVAGQRIDSPDEAEVVITRLSKNRIRMAPTGPPPRGGVQLIRNMDFEISEEDPTRAVGRGSGGAGMQGFQTTTSYDATATLAEGRIQIRATFDLGTTGRGLNTRMAVQSETNLQRIE